MMKSFKATPEHEAYRTALIDAMRGATAQHPDLSAMDLLAVAAQLVGQLIAQQDQTKVSPQQAMAIVSENIAVGNAEVIAHMLKQPTAGRA